MAAGRTVRLDAREHAHLRRDLTKDGQNPTHDLTVLVPGHDVVHGPRIVVEPRREREQTRAAPGEVLPHPLRFGRVAQDPPEVERRVGEEQVELGVVGLRQKVAEALLKGKAIRIEAKC